MLQPDEDLPRAAHEGSITLAGVAIRTYVLEDGRRIMNADDMTALHRVLKGGAQVKPDEAAAYAEFVSRSAKP